MSYIYLASPYSHPDPFVREDRYLRAMKEMSRLLRLRIAVYSPIVHCHELAKIADLPRDAGFWEEYNFTMLKGAEVLWVLMLPDWEESKGCAAEVAEALRHCKPVMYFEEGAMPNVESEHSEGCGEADQLYATTGLRPSE